MDTLSLILQALAAKQGAATAAPDSNARRATQPASQPAGALPNQGIFPDHRYAKATPNTPQTPANGTPKPVAAAAKATSPSTTSIVSGAAPYWTGSHREVGAPPAVTPAPLPPAALDRAPVAPSPAPLVHPDDGKPLGKACKPGRTVDWSRMPQRDRRSEPLNCDDTPRVSRALAVIDRLRRYSQAS